MLILITKWLDTGGDKAQTQNNPPFFLVVINLSNALNKNQSLDL